MYPCTNIGSILLNVSLDKGGFSTSISYVAVIASVAGIVSTADTSLIYVSKTVSVDIFDNWLFKGRPGTSINCGGCGDISISIVIIGKRVSITTILLSMGIAIYVEEQSCATGEPVSYAVLALFQQGILWQAFPSIFCLYFNVNSKSVIYGMLGLSIDIILAILIFSGSDSFVLTDPKLENINSAWVALIGVVVNLTVVGGDERDDPSVAGKLCI